ncbi:MAG: RNase P modulator RnpM [Bacillota bacterium]
MPKARKIPMRMCVGCQEMRPKKELIRVVRTPAGEIEIDSTGKKSGRGAYVCPRVECLQRACKEKRLEKALQRQVSREIYDMLVQRLNG